MNSKRNLGYEEKTFVQQGVLKKIRVHLKSDLGLVKTPIWYNKFIKQCQKNRKEEISAMVEQRKQEMKYMNRGHQQDLIRFIKKRKPQLLNKYSKKNMTEIFSGTILSGEYYGVSKCCTKEFIFNLLDENKNELKNSVNGVIPCKRCKKNNNFERELCRRRKSRVKFKDWFTHYFLFSEKEKSNFWLLQRPLFKENIDFCLRMKHLFWTFKQEGKPITIEDFKDSILDGVSGETYKKIFGILIVNYSIYNTGIKKKLF